ncbi:uncharacterized protein TNCV_3629791 [Trichonephila clavipes]|nr:uncharacterized protein TNCV_3629791 [Trichonephila clavipes]
MKNSSRPSGIVVSDTDCCAVERGFEFQRRQGSTRGLLVTDHVILNQGQVTWTTPELAPPLLAITPHQRKDVLALDRINVHRFSGTGFELVTRQATIRYLYHSATAATLSFDTVTNCCRVLPEGKESC